MQSFNNKHRLFQSGDRLVVAVSGGKDSMCLLHLLKQLPNELVVAHCNYQLRGSESDDDEAFILAYCKENQLKFRSIRFNTIELSKERKQSIQEVARDLRYAWLEDIRKEESAQLIVTAHHLQDNIETLVLNLSKGTGVKGIRGIQARNGLVIRPLLELSSEDIQAYIELNKLLFREDSSNKKLDYDRNKIRHEVLPVLRTINPSLDRSFINHFSRWNDISKMYEGALGFWQKQLFENRKGNIYITIKKLLGYSFVNSLLYELLTPFGFNSSTISDVLQSLQDPSLKEFVGDGFILYKDRKFLILQDLKKMDTASVYSIQVKQNKLVLPGEGLLTIQSKPIAKLSKLNKQPSWLYLDKDKLAFPLFVRQWKEGDYFYPYGLVKSSGNIGKKKVGKFLRDEKVDALTRKNTYVILSGQHIVAILGRRMDARFAVTDATQEVMIIRKK